jgi:hypothetical protein
MIVSSNGLAHFALRERTILCLWEVEEVDYTRVEYLHGKEGLLSQVLLLPTKIGASKASMKLCRWRRPITPEN